MLHERRTEAIYRRPFEESHGSKRHSSRLQKSPVISCACGNKAETYSTRGDFMVDICSACHPFYTRASEKFVDAAGRIERFNKKYGTKTPPTPAS